MNCIKNIRDYCNELKEDINIILKERDPVKIYIFIMHYIIEGFLTAIVFGILIFIYPDIWSFVIPNMNDSIRFGLRLFGGMNTHAGLTYCSAVFRANTKGEYKQLVLASYRLCVADILFTVGCLMALPTFGPVVWIPAIMDIVLFVSKFVLFVLGVAKKHYISENDYEEI
jgi:uncharacterized protein YjeT (DUF2065 family)